MKPITVAAAMAIIVGVSSVACGQSLPDGGMIPETDGLLQGGPGTGWPLRLAPGALLIHGNYCGIGNNGPGMPPIDALDAACMHHDSCTPDEGLPRCACNARFARETRAVAESRRLNSELRSLAGLVGSAIPLIACQP